MEKCMKNINKFETTVIVTYLNWIKAKDADRVIMHLNEGNFDFPLISDIGQYYLKDSKYYLESTSGDVEVASSEAEFEQYVLDKIK